MFLGYIIIIHKRRKGAGPSGTLIPPPEEVGVSASSHLDEWDEEQRLQAYQREVLPFWERFGHAPKRMWFELYGSREHRMDPRFVPADLYYNGLLPYLNNGAQQPGLMNKGYVDYLFSDVKRPETVALNIEGVYTDEKRNSIRI